MILAEKILAALDDADVMAELLATTPRTEIIRDAIQRVLDAQPAAGWRCEHGESLCRWWGMWLQAAQPLEKALKTHTKKCDGNLIKLIALEVKDADS